MTFEDASTTPSSVEAVADGEIVNTRIFHTPRALLFKACSKPDLLAQWWGPKNFTNTFHQFEMKPDGVWHYTMHGPDGVDYENKSVFVEIVAPERIILRHLDPDHEFLLTIIFVELEDKTELTWRMLFASAAECEKVREFVTKANEQNFDRLQDLLSSIRPADTTE